MLLDKKIIKKWTIKTPQPLNFFEIVFYRINSYIFAINKINNYEKMQILL